MHDRNDGKLIRFSEAMIPQENMWVLPTTRVPACCPAPTAAWSGSPWPSIPKHRLAYALNLHQPMTYHVEAVQIPRRQALAGWGVQGHRGEKQWGRVAAVNVDTGKMAWKFDTEQPLIGGALATGGGLLFYGEGNGLFTRPDAQTGKQLWEFNCGAGANAMPVSYTVKGRQYVAMGCGGNTQLDFKRGNTMVVFALPPQ